MITTMRGCVSHNDLCSSLFCQGLLDSASDYYTKPVAQITKCTCLISHNVWFYNLIGTCRLWIIYARNDTYSNVSVMITRLIWIICTSMSAVRERNLITQSLLQSGASWGICLMGCGIWEMRLTACCHMEQDHQWAWYQQGMCLHFFIPWTGYQDLSCPNETCFNRFSRASDRSYLGKVVIKNSRHVIFLPIVCDRWLKCTL